MSTSIQSRVASLPATIPSTGRPSAMGLACWAAIIVWGPLDMLVTASAWHLEANPLTLMLGLEQWLAVKLFLVLLVGGVYLQTQGWQDKRPLVAAWVMTLATIGAIFVGLNLAVLAGVSG